MLGGQETEVVEHPWQVGVTRQHLHPCTCIMQVGLVSPGETTPYCGGSILTSRHILTAAHCTSDRYTGGVREPSLVQVLVGEHHTADRRHVATISNHPKYN